MSRLFAALAGLVLALTFAACSSTPTPTPPPSSTTASTFGQPIDGIACDHGGHDNAYHIHAMLQLIAPGGALPPPANIGIDPTRCMYWVHTHDETGLIHIEAPAPVNATLGDFMNIWAATITTDSRRLRFMRALESGQTNVNGQVLTTPWRDLVLADNMTINIMLGGS